MQRNASGDEYGTKSRKQLEIKISNKNATSRSRVRRWELPSFATIIRQYESHSYPSVCLLCHPLIIYRSYVNVYLCIKQALFIRPMNMHCLMAVARCRVQTRRYHCLINHTQSHQTTLRTLTSSHRTPFSSPSRKFAEDSPCHPSRPSRFLSLGFHPLAIPPFTLPRDSAGRKPRRRNGH